LLCFGLSLSPQLVEKMLNGFCMSADEAVLVAKVEIEAQP